MAKFNLPNNTVIEHLFGKKSSASEEQTTPENRSDNELISIDSKTLPIGSHGFSYFKEHNCFYADKTKVIELLEKAQASNFFIHRPKGLGKTTLLSMLKSFYDISSKGIYEYIFKDLYIYNKNLPTSNTFCILEFDFENIDTIEDFSLEIISGIKNFCSKYHLRFEYQYHIGNNPITFMKTLLTDFFNCYLDSERKEPIYLMVDNYDSFDFQSPIEKYHQILSNPETLRTFYHAIKKAQQRGIVSRSLCAGVIPIYHCFNYIQVGFNAVDLSFNPKFIDCVGLTENEINSLVKAVANNKNLSMEEVTETICSNLDGYAFTFNDTCRIFNTKSCLKLISQVLSPSPFAATPLKMQTEFRILSSIYENYSRNLNEIDLALKDNNEYIMKNLLNLWSDNTTEQICTILYFAGLFTLRSSIQTNTGEVRLSFRLTNVTIANTWKAVLNTKHKFMS